ncbi:MAG TPA: hypothetical protein VGA51_03400 [Casimicrobiaceae bacterium]
MTALQPVARSYWSLAADLAGTGSAGSADETIRRLRALDPHVGCLVSPADRPRPVVLPSYGGTCETLNLTPLLALLLHRYGVPVLVHGFAHDEPNCAATGTVLAQLGVIASDMDDAQARLAHGALAYVSVDVLAPPLAELLSAGAASGARMLASLIDPFASDSYRVVGAACANDLARIREFLAATRANALLLVGSDGEPFADPRAPSALEHFADGVRSICAEAESMAPSELPALLEAADAQSTAGWTERALCGEVPVPLPLLAEIGCCLAGARRSGADAAATAA